MEAPNGEIFNLSGGTEIPLQDSIAILETLIQKKIKKKIVEDCKFEMERMLGDISKAKTVLGYKPQYSLKKGLVEQIKWMQSLKPFSPL